MLSELKWIARHASKYRLSVFVQVVLGIAAVIMGLAGSVASKFLINAVTGGQNSGIWLAGALMVFMMLSGIGLRALSGRIVAKINIRVKNELSIDVFKKIVEAKWEALSAFRSGDILNRLSSDVQTVSGGVTGLIPGLFTGLVQFLGALGIMLYYDPSMALFALAGAPVTVLVSRVLIKRMRKYNAEMRSMDSDMMNMQDETFSNIQTIKSLGVSGLFVRRMEKLQKNYKDTYMEYNRFTVGTSAFMSVIGMAVSTCCFCWGVYRLWLGAIDFGVFAMFLQLAGTLSGAFSSLVGLVPQTISCATSAGRIIAVTGLDKEECPPAVLSGNKSVGIELKNLSFAYSDGKYVLKNVDMCIKPGMVVGVVGASGAGKTTLMRIILGLVGHEGSAQMFDTLSNRAELSGSTRPYVSYVPQGNTLFAGSIAENLRMVKEDASDSELEAALRAACAWNFVEKLPQGINSPVGESGNGLSEGQAQRISIARAVLKNAPLLLLDEATSALDAETEEQVLSNIMRTGRTCIVCTHRPGALELCDCVFRIQNTQIIMPDKG